MKKILLLIVCLAITNFVSAQATYTSNATGNWASAGSWTVTSGSDSDSDAWPDSNDTVIIGSSHTVTVATAAAASEITISGVSTVLNLNANLTVSGDVTNGGTINITSGNFTCSGASATYTNNRYTNISAGYYLNMQGTSSTLANNREITTYATSSSTARVIVMGTFTEAEGENGQYARYVNGLGDVGTSTGWDLIGSPTTDTSISTFTTTQNAGEIATNGSGNSILYGVGFYDPTDSDWDTYGGSATTNVISSAGNFDNAKGYQMATDNGGVVEFVGTLHYGNTTQSIQSYDADGDGGANGSRWNIVANPYMSFINANDNDDATNNVLTANASLLHASNTALYFWDGDSYVAVNHSSSSSSYDYIAPMQGFLVAPAYSGSAVNFSFTKAMQTTSGTDDAVLIQSDIMTDNESELILNISQDNLNRKTEIYFNDSGTDGLDPGYDAAAFAIMNTYLSTRLVDNSSNEGENFSIQTLSYSDMNSKVIPLVVNAIGGEEMTIGISSQTVPADTYIYFEDVEEGTLIDFKAEDFVYTPTSDLEGAGRFFIHMSADTMSNEDVSTSMLNAYKEIDASFITIEGLATQTNETNVSLYNILGRKVLSTTLNNNMNTQTISTIGLSAGIYVIELESGTDRLTKKLIIK